MTSANAPRVLVVDDEPSICRSCEKILVREGYEVTTVTSGAAALDLLGRGPFDLVFTDLKMAEMGGMELLEALRSQYPDIVPVVITGFATIASVVETMKVGAFDYLPKPFTPDEMAAVARKAWDRRQLLVRSHGAPAPATDDPAMFAGIVGASPKMQEVYRNLRKVAATSSTVLIIGETGTGKELVARAIHTLSPRKHERFFAVDCGALTVTLLESELFGHVKGSFTGATSDKRGIFEVANRGTVFLDEICNVDVEVQAKLLRFIQEREFLPVGATQPRHVDVRLVFATNRDLEKMVRDGTFREDLYYRLYVFPIQLPPLRERREDIPLLACHLLAKSRERCAKPVARFSEDALRLLGQFRASPSAPDTRAADPAGRPADSRHQQGVPRAQEAAARAGRHRPRARVRARSPPAQRLERHPRGRRRRDPAPELPDADAKARRAGRPWAGTRRCGQ